MIKKNTNVELRMIVLEERSGVVSPTKTSGVPEQNDLANFYEYQSFAICFLFPPFLSFVQVLLLQVFLTLSRSTKIHT